MRKIAQTTDDIFTVTHQYFWERVDGTDPKDVQHLQDLYDGSIRRVDTELAKLFKWMRDQDLTRETLVVILSDHGEEFQDHGAFLHTRIYQEALHVPLIMIFPRDDPDRPRRKRVAAPVRLIDVMPTLLDYLDIEAPSGLQGESLMPLMLGTGPGPPTRVVSSYTRRGYTSLRENGWKIIQHVQRRFQGPGFVTRRELYDLDTDPSEQRDLAAQEPERLKALADLSTQLNDEARGIYETIPPGPAIDPDEQTTEELRALGYVE
jgi:arylsulfatase A-like enzyme